MPILKLSTRQSGADLARYNRFDSNGNEREAAFASNLAGAHNAQDAERQFSAAREHFGKNDGIQAREAYLSFQRTDLGDMANPDGSPNWDRLAQYGSDFAERAGIADKHQYYVVAHDDKPHPHLHIVWNSVSDVDGRKYHADEHGRVHLNALRDINDQLAREHGIQRELDRHRNPERAPDAVIRAVERHGHAYSWKMDLQNRIKESASRSLDEAQFLKTLNGHGVSVRIRANAYSYSFTDASGLKRVIRGSRLGEPYQRASLVERLHGQSADFSDHLDPERRAHQMKAQRLDFQDWKTELRDKIQEAKRKATSPEQFTSRLAAKGVTLEHQDRGDYSYSFTDSLSARHDQIPASSLGRSYSRENTERHLEENALRKRTTVNIAWASRRSGTEDDFRRWLRDRGIALSKDADRYTYTITTPSGQRTFQGEALSRHISTDAVRLRYSENADVRALHQIMASARSLAAGPGDYLSRLQARGVKLHRDEAGRALLHYRGGIHDAAKFTRTPLDHMTFSRATRPVTDPLAVIEGMAQRISRDVGAVSREDHYEGPDFVRARERRRRIAPAIDTETVHEDF